MNYALTDNVPFVKLKKIFLALLFFHDLLSLKSFLCLDMNLFVHMIFACLAEVDPLGYQRFVHMNKILVRRLTAILIEYAILHLYFVSIFLNNI